MSEALSYMIPGVPFGCTMALIAIGLVLTYRSTGVFNFAFGAQAYTAAYLYAFFTAHGLARGVAGVLAIVVISPCIGILADRLVFSRITSGTVSYTHLTLPTKRIV